MGNDRCLECDRAIAQDYIDGKRTAPGPYECRLGLDDLACPLKIDGKVRAVLIGGQIVPNDNARVEKIRRNIRELTGDELADELLPLVDEDRHAQWDNNPDYAEFRINTLKEFGSVCQEILDTLRRAQKDAVRLEVLQKSNEVLGSPALSGPERWYEQADKLLVSFCSLVGLEEMRLYTREGKSYVRRCPLGDPKEQVPARQVVPVLPADIPARASDGEAVMTLARQLAPGTDNVSFYLSRTQVEGTLDNVPLSTLLTLRGRVDEVYQDLIVDFSRVLAQRADFASLVLHLEKIHAKYRRTVAEVAHDFRTPLQEIALKLDDIAQLPEIRNKADTAAEIRDCIKRIIEANERTRPLQQEAVESQTEIDVVELVTQLIADMQPLARHHPCELKREEHWAVQLQVRGVRSRLRRAFENLLENAIKYSFLGKDTPEGYQSHEVRVWVQEHTSHLARVRISNYGIGVPRELIERVREPGERGLVPEPRRERPGTGWGLPIAVRAIEDHGGWLDISSEPADADPRATGEEYHRYETVVDVYVPIIR
jgi:signal transduction histidine kinase